MTHRSSGVRNQRASWRALARLAFLLVLALHLSALPSTQAGRQRTGGEASPGAAAMPVTVLVDDFVPQPCQGDSIYYYNRLGGDRGGLNDGALQFASGVVTSTVAPGRDWCGLWLALNHPLREMAPLDLQAILPAPIAASYQSQITGVDVRLLGGTPGRTVRLEIKDKRVGGVLWSREARLTGLTQTLSYDLPALGEATEMVLVLDHAASGEYVVVDDIAMRASSAVTDTAWAGFVWSYGMLLNNLNRVTGLVRDKAQYASGEFDAVQATGALAAATAVAYQLGVVGRADAIEIVDQISRTLLVDMPRYHGLWPHFVQVLPSGAIHIAPGTEWSSIDTVIAAVGLLGAQQGLGLDTRRTESLLQEIDWADLRLPGGISHGYSYGGQRIPSAWDTFGGESWLVALAHAAATGQTASIPYATPPTANGSGFIDELAWLFAPPPLCHDAWGNDWALYRHAAARAQIAYYADSSCYGARGLFGLSAGELPMPWGAPCSQTYQAFGVGGRWGSAHDGAALLGAPVVVPHYAALVASLVPAEATAEWTWLIRQGLFTPLNNVESLVLPQDERCTVDGLQWNHLKGSWSLALQALGWGRYLAERQGMPPVLWQTARDNAFVRRGYDLLVTHCRYLPSVSRNVPD